MKAKLFFLTLTIFLFVAIVYNQHHHDEHQKPTKPSAKHADLVMGTFAEITACAGDEKTAQLAVEAGYQRLRDVNDTMSDYVDDSEIGKINALPANTPFVMSEETFFCTKTAIELSKATGGAFDPTCRPLISLWKTCGKRNSTPSQAELKESQSRVGVDKISLDANARTITFRQVGVQLDLGGIAKGYSLDLAADAMKAAGATDMLINVGGDVLAIGNQPTGQPWVIALAHPFDDRQYFCKLRLTHKAVATSGNQQRFSMIDGKRYSHIVDPRTGWPTEQAPSVTVIAPDGITADGFATVFSVLTIDEGMKLAEKYPEIEVLWITGDKENPVVHQTPGFRDHVVDKAR